MDIKNTELTELLLRTKNIPKKTLIDGLRIGLNKYPTKSNDMLAHLIYNRGSDKQGAVLISKPTLQNFKKLLRTKKCLSTYGDLFGLFDSRQLLILTKKKNRGTNFNDVRVNLMNYRSYNWKIIT